MSAPRRMDLQVSGVTQLTQDFGTIENVLAVCDVKVFAANHSRHRSVEHTHIATDAPLGVHKFEFVIGPIPAGGARGLPYVRPLYPARHEAVFHPTLLS